MTVTESDLGVTEKWRCDFAPDLTVFCVSRREEGSVKPCA